MRRIFGLIAVLAVLLPQAARANRAETLLIPTRVVMEKNDRFTTVVIRNIGDATGNLSVELIDMTMGETGGVVQLEEGKSDPWSAIPILRVSPHSITLKPGESQNVRIMLRKPEGLPAGEYRSHLKVKVDEDNVEAAASKTAEDLKAASIAVKAKLALTIPVIVRNGETTIAIKIDSPKIGHDAMGKPEVDMTLLREGNRSVMGDFTFTYTGPDGKSQLIKTFPGIPVYRSTERRKVSIPMDDIPAGINLDKGKLAVAYTAQEKEGGMKLAEATIDLSVR